MSGANNHQEELPLLAHNPEDAVDAEGFPTRAPPAYDGPPAYARWEYDHPPSDTAPAHYDRPPSDTAPPYTIHAGEAVYRHTKTQLELALALDPSAYITSFLSIVDELIQEENNNHTPLCCHRYKKLATILNAIRELVLQNTPKNARTCLNAATHLNEIFPRAHSKVEVFGPKERTNKLIKTGLSTTFLLGLGILSTILIVGIAAGVSVGGLDLLMNSIVKVFGQGALWVTVAAATASAIQGSNCIKTLNSLILNEETKGLKEVREYATPFLKPSQPRSVLQIFSSYCPV